MPRPLQLLLFAALAALGNVSHAQTGVALAPTVQSLGNSDAYIALSSRQVSDQFATRAFTKVWTAKGDVNPLKIIAKYSPAGTSPAPREMLRSMRKSGFTGLKHFEAMAILRARSRGQAIGLYAELRLVETDGYRLVASPTAPTRDLYRIEDGRRVYAQVKVLSRGPKYYLKEMHTDDSSKRFLVPNDHVEPLKKLIQEETRAAGNRGDTKRVDFLERQLRRVGGAGADYDTLVSEHDVAWKQRRNEVISTRLGWVVGGVFTLTFIGRDLERACAGTMTWTEFQQNVLHAVSTIAGSAWAGYVAKEFFDARPLRVAGAAGAAAFAVEEVFLAMRYRSFVEAMRSGSFWVATARNVTAVAGGTAGVIAGAKAGASVGAWFGSRGVAIGTTLGGLAGGITGAFGATCGFRWVMDAVNRGALHAEFARQLEANRERLATQANQ